MIKLNGKYLTSLLLVATISVVTTGAALSYNLSIQKGTKILSLPDDETLDYEMVSSKPEVINIKTLEYEKRSIEGCVDNKIVFSCLRETSDNDKLNGTTFYSIDNGEEKSIYSNNKIMKSSGTFGMFSISQDKTKIILNDKGFGEYGKPFGVYVHDAIKNNLIKVTDISKEFTSFTNIKLGEGISMNYSAYNGSGWSVDGKSVIYIINSAKNTFDFFIYNLNTDSTEKYTLIDFKHNFIALSMPKLSSDGRYIYFTGHCQSSSLVYRLYRIDLTRKDIEAEWLTDHAGYYHLSDDGKRVVFMDCLRNSPKRNIYIFDTLTKEEKVIVENPLCLFDISADGNKIVYTVKNEDSIDVKAAHIKNNGIGNSTTIYKAGLNEFIDRAFWNIDGSKVIIETEHGKSYVVELRYKN
ncbi:MAG TPA: hypothetical protein PK566_04145 [Pseudobacteroides sp.]|nr:hypothetical protein [Pseudobacteroides sp.]